MGSNKSTISTERKIEIILELIACQFVIIFGGYLIYLEIMALWFYDDLMSGNFFNPFAHFGIDVLDPFGLRD